MSLFTRSKFARNPRRARPWTTILIVAIFFVALGAPQQAKAFPGEAFSAAVWKQVVETIRNIGDRAVKAVKDISYKNALSTFTAKIAQDTAVYLGSGGTGQKPLFLTNPGKYLEDVGNAAAGDYVDKISVAVFNKSACTFDLTQNINIDKFLRAAITKVTPNYCEQRVFGGTEAAQKAFPFFTLLKGGLLDDTYKVREPFRTQWKAAINDGTFLTDINYVDGVIASTPLPATSAELRYPIAPDSGPELEQIKAGLSEDLDYAKVLYNTLLHDMNSQCQKPDGTGPALNTTSTPQAKCAVFYTFFVKGYVDIQSNIQARLQQCQNAGVSETTSRCTLTQIGRNLDPRRVKPGNISAMFDPNQNPLSLLLSSVNDAQDLTLKARANTQFEQTASTVVGVKSKITGEVKTPKETVQNTANAAVNGANTAEKTYTGSSIADIFFRTFTRTLMSKLIQKTFVRGYNPRLDTSITNDFENFLGASATPVIVESLQVPTIDTSEKVDILDEYTTCPTFEPARTVNNCVIDQDFRAAIDEGLTVDEAIKQGKLHPERPFGYIRSGSGDFGRLSEPSSPDQGYAASSMKKLRLAGVIPLGWEIAAEEIRKSGNPATLGQVLGQYCQKKIDGTCDTSVTFYRLVSGGWLFKAHETSCRARVYGPFLDGPNSKERQQVCVDVQTCVVEDPQTGKCKLFGYCTREDTLVWKFPEGSKTCQADQASCGTFANEKGTQSSYLRTALAAPSGNAANNRFCPVDAGGCSAYVNAQDPESPSGAQYFFSSKTEQCKVEDSGTNKYTRQSDSAIFYLKNPPQCNATEVGCDGFTPSGGGTQVPAVYKSGTDSCPSSCVGLNSFRELGAGEVPTGVIETFIPGTATQCTNAEVGCQEYTNLNAVAQGGEGKEYYSSLRQCEKPGLAGQGTYFSWEGIDTAGLQLKSWRLKISSVDDPANQCAVSPSNLDCKEFIDISGASHPALLSKVVVVTDACVALRRTSDGQQANALPAESGQCRAQVAGCTAYLGSGSNNVRSVAKYDFEDGTVPGGWIGSPSSETGPSGTNHFIGNVRTIGYEMREPLRQGSTYTITFDARLAVAVASPSAFMGVTVSAATLTNNTEILTTDWRRFSVTYTPSEIINSPTVLLYAAHPSYSAGYYIDNFEITESSVGAGARLTLVKGSWNTPAECTADFARCGEYQSALHGSKVTAYQFTNSCVPERIGCDAFTKNTGIGSSDTTVRYKVNRSEFVGVESAAGCTGLDDSSGAVVGKKIVSDPANPSAFIGQCTAAQVGCQLFTDESGSKVAFKPPVTPSEIAAASCKPEAASCTAYATDFGPSGVAFNRTFYYLANSVPKSSSCTTVGPDCLSFNVPTIGADGTPTTQPQRISVTADRKCAEWLYPRTIAPTFDENTRKFRNIVYSLGRCREADSSDPTLCKTPVGINDFDYGPANGGKGPLLDIGAYRRGLSGGLGGKVWDFVGYSLYNQYPVEYLTQQKANTPEALNRGAGYDLPINNPNALQGGSLTLYPTCRAYPESDSPFPGGDVIHGTRVINPSFNNANLFEPGRGVKNECSYKKVTYDRFDKITKFFDPDSLNTGKVCVGGNEEGKECVAKSDCSGDGLCEAPKKLSSFYGWRGYCLEPDIAKPINGTSNQFACATWYPVDLIKGEVDLFNYHPEAGFTGTAYYCLEGIDNQKLDMKVPNYDNQDSVFFPHQQDLAPVKNTLQVTGIEKYDMRSVSSITLTMKPIKNEDAVVDYNHNNEWPTNITLTPDKVFGGRTESITTIYKAEKSGQLTYKFDVFRHDGKTEWRLYPVADDGSVPKSVVPQDLGSFVSKDNICRDIVGDQSANLNCIWASFTFDDNTHKLETIKFAGNDDTGSDWNYHIPYTATINPGLACQAIAQVSAPFTNKLLNPDLKTSVRTPDLGYSYTSERSQANGGLGFGQMALDTDPKSYSLQNGVFYLSNEGTLGSPYSCSGDCLSSPDSLWNTSALKSGNKPGVCSNDLLCMAKERIKTLFAQAANSWIFLGDLYKISPSGIWDITASGVDPVIYAPILKEQSPAGEVYDIAPNGAGKDTFAINGDINPSGTLSVSKDRLVTAIFYAYNPNGEQMPIKGVEVDWGDGTPEDGTPDKGFYRNRKPGCVNSPLNWGDYSDACETTPWKFSHDYGGSAGIHVITVTITDNWGRKQTAPRSIRVN